MKFTVQEKENVKKELVASLSDELEIVKIIIFGSFLKVEDPHDLDVAIFQDSREAYLPLALKYRKKTSSLARKIPLDIIPLKPECRGSYMLDEIALGEVIYER